MPDKQTDAAEDAGDEMIAVPRWVLDALVNELTMWSEHHGASDEPGCDVCDAIEIAGRASQTGVAPPRRSPGAGGDNG